MSQVFRVERTKNFTVMSNHHFKNKNLSLKAKGLLSLMLSLPDDWNYNMQGLASLSRDKLKHQDLGQMQMYVNYYDRYEKQDFENPTIGVLMCPDKNDAMVELTLPENSNIYASKYQLYLPDKKLLQDKLKEWMQEETGGEC